MRRWRWLLLLLAMVGSVASVVAGCFIDIPDVQGVTADAAIEPADADAGLDDQDAASTDAGLIAYDCMGPAIPLLYTSSGIALVNGLSLDSQQVFVASNGGILAIKRSLPLQKLHPQLPTGVDDVVADGDGGAFFVASGDLYYFAVSYTHLTLPTNREV